jgi:hypothetical protein
VIPGTTAASPDDRGGTDPQLAEALAGRDPLVIARAIVDARLLVPVAAQPAAQGDAEMAVPALVDDTGRRALPVFSSVDALRAWRPDARPVPMPGRRVLAGAVAEGYDAVVLDVAGPQPVVLEGDDLAELAAGC